MQTPEQRTAAAEKAKEAAERVREADAARDILCHALRDAGIVLPSLHVDPASCTGETPRPLVDLGRCNVATARELAAVLGRAASAGGGRSRPATSAPDAPVPAPSGPATAASRPEEKDR